MFFHLCLVSVLFQLHPYLKSNFTETLFLVFSLQTANDALHFGTKLPSLNMSITLHAHYTLGYIQPPLQWRLTTSPHYAPPLQQQWEVCLHSSQTSSSQSPGGGPIGCLLPQGYLPVYTSRGKERERIGGVIFIEFNYPIYMDNPTLVRNWFTPQTNLTPHMQTDFTPSEVN